MALHSVDIAVFIITKYMIAILECCCLRYNEVVEAENKVLWLICLLDQFFDCQCILPLLSQIAMSIC